MTLPERLIEQVSPFSAISRWNCSLVYWLTRPRSERSRSDEELAAKVRASFLSSDRTYGARRIWRDLLADGASCGLHRIERLMRSQALRSRPRRRRLPPDLGERQASAIATNVLDRSFEAAAINCQAKPLPA